MLKFACPRCKKVIAAPESSAGTAAACPHCRQPLRIPGPLPPAPAAPPRPPAAPARAPVAPPPPPVSVKQELPADFPREAAGLFLRLVRANPPSAVDARGALREYLAALDRRLSAQLREVLRHPDFRRLEATWRGLQYLVSRTESSPTLQLRLLNVSKPELARDLRRADSFDLSALFAKISEPYSQPGGQPYGLLLGDYEFGTDAEDVALLELIAQVAADAHAPFVAAASPSLFGFASWMNLGLPCDLTGRVPGGDAATWEAFRESEGARFVALTLPRIRARVPHGAAARRGTAFAFEEAANPTDSDGHLWMSAAWAYAARLTDAFAKDGWLARTRGIEGGGAVRGLPVAAAPTGVGDEEKTCVTEIALSDRHEHELASLGLLPLIHCKGRDFAAFLSAASCHKPRQYANAAATAQAELAAKLNYVLCAGRFAHYLRLLALQWLPTAQDRGECERWLNEWVGTYVIDDPQRYADEEMARRPLAAARVELREVQDRPGHYRLTAHLTPNYQLEEQTAPIRVSLEIRRR